MKQSRVGRANRANIGIFNSQICILPLFLVLFLQIIGCTFVWVNYKNIQYKSFWTLWQMQFSFSLSVTIKGFICSFTFVCRYITVQARGLRAPEAVTLLTVKYVFSHFSWYFFFKNLTYIYVGTYTKYLFQYKASGNFDKFVLQNWFSL